MEQPPTIFADADAIGVAVAEEIVHGIVSANAQNRNFVLGAPSGRTPRPTYRALAGLIADRPELDLSGFHVVMMDDYVITDPVTGAPARVPADAPYSCERFARVEIAGAINAAAAGPGIPEQNLWFPDPADPAAYDRDIMALGGVDLFILASGASDGHVAFNPPGSAADSTTRVVTLSIETRLDNMHTFPSFASLDEVPLRGVTVGIGTIRDQSRRAVMLATGKAKRLAVSRLLSADAYEPDWPSTVVHACRHPDIYVDQAALPVGEAAP